MKNSGLKKVCIKNCTCYHINDLIKIENFDLGNILLDEKLRGNIVIYDISYKNLIGLKPLRIRFDKIDRFTRVYNGTRYLVFFDPEKNEAIHNTIRYLITQKKWYYVYFFPLLHKIQS